MSDEDIDAVNDHTAFALEVCSSGNYRSTAWPVARCHHSFAQINGIGSTHRMLASSPASILNQKPTDLGIQNRMVMSCGFSRSAGSIRRPDG